MSRSFSTTSSVLAINRFWSVWIFWIISYVAGSEPSSLRQRCTFIGFSSSSESAFTFVFSWSSSRCAAMSSRRRSSSWLLEPFEIVSSRCMSRTLSRSTRTSCTRAAYCASPLRSVLIWILSFSYSSASSSLRRMSCVPRMSRSLMTWSYSLRCVSASSSMRRIMLASRRISASCLWMTSSFDSSSRRMREISLRICSHCFSTFWCANDSFTSASSFAAISSLSCSIWWFMILNLRFISAISSCASIRFFEYRLRSERTDSYRCCCCLSFASHSLDLLLQLVHAHVAQLHLLHRLQVERALLARLDAVALALLLELVDRLALLDRLGLERVHLVLERVRDALLLLHARLLLVHLLVRLRRLLHLQVALALDDLELLRAHDLLVLEHVEVLLQRHDLGLREQERRLRLVEQLAVLDRRAVLALDLALHLRLLGAEPHDLLAPQLALLLDRHVLEVQLLVLEDLLLEVLGQLLRALVERVVVAQVLLHRRARLGQLLLELADLRLRRHDLGAHRLLLHRALVELAARVAQLLVEPLAPPLLAQHLGLPRREVLLERLACSGVRERRARARA